MKGKIKTFPAILMAVFMPCILTQAQVTIGDDALPRTGLVLDMKNTHATGYTGGVMFPHVEIIDLTQIPESFTEESALKTSATKQKDLEGMMVYNTTANADKGIVTGYYLWDGEQWKALPTAEPTRKEEILGTVMGRSGHSYTTYLLDNGTRWMVDNSKEGPHMGFGYGDKKGAFIQSTSETDNVQVLGAKGYYYTWHQAVSKTGDQFNVCPQGWILPEDADVEILKTAVQHDMANNGGMGIAQWWMSGAAYAGYYDGKPNYWNQWNLVGVWWSASAECQRFFINSEGEPHMYGPGEHANAWFSVRCIQRQ